MTDQKPVALVTGASRGIGAAILRRLAADGYEVHGTATSDAGVAAIREQLDGSPGQGHVYNASDKDALEALVQAVPEVDVLVSNAGITKDGLFMRMKDEAFDDVVETNLAAPFRLARSYIRGMVKRRAGRIIMISSVVATTGNFGQANYTASKAGVEGMVRSIAREVGARGITVNSVAPGFIDTDMTSKLPENIKTKLLEQIPLGRMGEAEEIAAVVGFLASPAAAYITGATIPVNGGLSMG